MSLSRDPDPRTRDQGAVEPPRRWSLAARLTIWYTGSAFALVIIAIGFMYWTLVVSLDREDDRFLANNVQVLRELLHSQSGSGEALKQEVGWEFSFRQYAEVYVRVLDSQGRIIVETPGMDEELPSIRFPHPVDVGVEPSRGSDRTSSRGKPFRVMAVRAVTWPGEVGPGVIQVALSNASEEGLLAKYRRRLLHILGFALIACAVVGYQIARQGIRPVEEISEAARRVRTTTLHQRIETRGLPAELFTLAVTFNEMLTRLEDSFSRLSQFSADIAHELRTPINNLRGVAEVTLSHPRSDEEYRDALGSCLEEGVRLSQLIDRLLFLARTEDPQTKIGREAVDVKMELAVVREFYDAAATDAGIALAIEVPAGLSAMLDRTLFQRAVGNLVANALAHTPRGGAVTLTAWAEPDMVSIRVSDTGCGISAQHLPYLFDRFYRADEARSTAHGSIGLGLAIVKAIMTLHGGSVEVASQIGRGTDATLIFPRFPNDALASDALPQRDPRTPIRSV